MYVELDIPQSFTSQGEVKPGSAHVEPCEQKCPGAFSRFISKTGLEVDNKAMER